MTLLPQYTDDVLGPASTWAKDTEMDELDEDNTSYFASPPLPPIGVFDTGLKNMSHIPHSTVTVAPMPSVGSGPSGATLVPNDNISEFGDSHSRANTLGLNFPRVSLTPDTDTPPNTRYPSPAFAYSPTPGLTMCATADSTPGPVYSDTDSAYSSRASTPQVATRGVFHNNANTRGVFRSDSLVSSATSSESGCAPAVGHLNLGTAHAPQNAPVQVPTMPMSREYALTTPAPVRLMIGGGGRKNSAVASGKFVPKRPHLCPWETCDRSTKTFRSNADLQRHIRSHKGEKLHVCPAVDCGKRYGQQNKMVKHVEQLHPHLISLVELSRTRTRRRPGTVTPSRNISGIPGSSTPSTATPSPANHATHHQLPPLRAQVPYYPYVPSYPMAPGPVAHYRPAPLSPRAAMMNPNTHHHDGYASCASTHVSPTLYSSATNATPASPGLPSFVSQFGSSATWWSQQ